MRDGRGTGVLVPTRKTSCEVVCRATWRAVFFFFQAEDGIRDDLVTGVQTCALPIFARRHRLAVIEDAGSACAASSITARRWRRAMSRIASISQGWPYRWTGMIALRSEERRVGKECRSRWSPYH